ncbi:histidine phosphatase family protein [Streptomyces hebeiensis]|uniref:Histidine phosphatase family protein n=1 Tax=Streptomyces hebeiensis TaxID=229486 RepID=A0ABN1UHR3_9ACTN
MTTRVMSTRVMFVSPAMGPALREARFPVADGEEPYGHEKAGRGRAADALDANALDGVGLRQAEAVAASLRDRAGDGSPLRSTARYVSPTPRCRRTADVLGLAAEPLPGLAPCAMGRWRGRTLDEVAAAEPDAVAGWLTDPAAAPHGGESLDHFLARVGRRLDTLNTAAAAAAAATATAAATDTAENADIDTDTDTQADGTGTGTGRILVVAEPDVIRAATVHALGAPPAAFWRIDVRPLTLTELGGRAGRWNLIGGRPLHHDRP